MNDPYVMYFIIKKSLGMNAGKIASQVGHAVQEMILFYAQDHSRALTPTEHQHMVATREWLASDYRKVVLGASDQEFDEVRLIQDITVITDLGFTQVPAGTQTCIGLWPMRKSEAPPAIKILLPLKK